MAGLLSGLAGLGLEDLENVDIYAVPKPDAKEELKKAQTEGSKIEEKDLIYDKVFECPVCDSKFTSKVMKTGKAKTLGTDQDLRIRFEGIDSIKYDVELCPKCGYAALNRYFPHISFGQAKLIRDNISQKVHLRAYSGETYTYDEALERYKLCLANAVVKRAKSSEKAFICLKSGWLMRGYQEYLLETGEGDKEKMKELKAMEDSYLLNAYNGFLEAAGSEGFPLCGMDEMTINYLLAVLAARYKKYDIAGKMIAAILNSVSASSRIKDKARELKEQLLGEVNKK